MYDVKIVGGIAFREKDLLKAYENPDKDKYTVEMIDGTTLIYPAQSAAQEAEVKRSAEGRVDFRGLKDAKIVDTKRNDVYRLMGCENVLVDADNAKDSDWIQVTNRRLSTGVIQISKNNTICLNKNDLFSLPEISDFLFVDDDTDINA